MPATPWVVLPRNPSARKLALLPVPVCTPMSTIGNRAVDVAPAGRYSTTCRFLPRVVGWLPESATVWNFIPAMPPKVLPQSKIMVRHSSSPLRMAAAGSK